ncbi:MAG: DsbA family protein, partial [Agromyces sp.]
LDELVRIAEQCGIDPTEAREALESGRFADAVAADVRQAAEYGITGVPFFVVDGRFGVSGAQSAETFAAVLTEAAQS